MLFAVLIVYLGYFTATSEQEMINNSYNSRQEILLSRNYRGTIFSKDGEILAETVLDSEQNETRSYPYGNLFFPCGRIFHTGTYGRGSSCELLFD